MKKILFLFMIMVTTLSFSLLLTSQAGAADNSTQSISFTYSSVYNKDYDISNYSVTSSAKIYDISIESKLLDYLLLNNKDIKITFGDKGVITIPAEALNTTEYINTKKSEDSFSVKVHIALTKEGTIYDYFSESEMNSQGLYCDPKLSFEITCEIMADGAERYELSQFAAPVKVTQPYVWGTDVYMPATQNEALLRYYFIDVDNPDRYGNYRWTFIGGSVDKANDELTGSITKTGVYCGVSSTKHTSDSSSTGSTGDNTSIVSSQTGFADMSGHWAENDVIYLQRKNIILSSSGNFLPENNITRAEFAVYITRILSLKSDDSAAGKFTDLNSDAYYYQAVISAASAGLINGKTENTFAPNEAITRQEMAALMLRALNKVNKVPVDYDNALDNFGDRSRVSDWAQSSCAAIVKAGLIVGKQNNCFCPQDTTTRAEAVVILARLYRYIYE